MMPARQSRDSNAASGTEIAAARSIAITPTLSRVSVDKNSCQRLDTGNHSVRLYRVEAFGTSLIHGFRQVWAVRPLDGQRAAPSLRFDGAVVPYCSLDAST